jgi:excisionase family DNA binding protein
MEKDRLEVLRAKVARFTSATTHHTAHMADYRTELATLRAGVARRKPVDTSGPWLTPTAAARLASVSRRTLDRWIARGLLRVSRVGKVVRVSRESLDRLLAGPEVAP